MLFLPLFGVKEVCRQYQLLFLNTESFTLMTSSIFHKLIGHLFGITLQKIYMLHYHSTWYWFIAIILFKIFMMYALVEICAMVKVVYCSRVGIMYDCHYRLPRHDCQINCNLNSSEHGSIHSIHRIGS